jgi:DNA replication protein DnaC
VLGGVVYLETHSVCDPCCELRESTDTEKRREAAARKEFERVVPVSYRKTELSHPNFNTPLWEQLKKWKPEQGWLGLVGETGRSKTRCLSLLAKRLAWNGYKLEWCIATRFQWAAQRQWSDDEGYKAREWLRRWKRAEVLILDDLGKQKWTDSVEQEFFDMLEHRTSNELLTLWSANTHPEQMIKAKQLTRDRGAPIVGRLLDFSEIVLV